MRQSNGFSLTELLLALALSSILIMSLLAVYQYVVAGYFQQQRQYYQLQQLRLADAQIRYRLQHKAAEQCTDKVDDFRIKIDKKLPFSTQLELAPGSENLVINSCRRYHGHDRMQPSVYFVAKNKQAEQYSLYEKLAQAKPEKLATGIKALNARIWLYSHAKLYQLDHYATARAKPALLQLELVLSPHMLHLEGALSHGWEIDVKLPQA